MAEFVGLILTYGGIPMLLVGWIWLAVNGFRVAPRWGILVTLVPTFSASFLALDHWKQFRTPLLLHLAGVLGVLVGPRLLPGWC